MADQQDAPIEASGTAVPETMDTSAESDTGATQQPAADADKKKEMVKGGDAAEPAEAATPLDEAEEKKKLLAARSTALRSSMAARSISLVDVNDTLVFDVYQAYLNAEGMATIAASLRNETRDDLLFSRLRLLAVLSHHADFEKHATVAIQEDLMQALASILPSSGTPAPKWMSAYLLCAEALFVWGENIKQPDASASEEGSKEIITGSTHAEMREPLAMKALELLGEEKASGEDILAGLRLLVLLTRQYDIATAMIKSDGLKILLGTVSRAPKAQLRSCQSMVTMIMRHCSEDSATLQIIMGKEIRAWFARPRNQQAQVSHFVSNIRHAALRDPRTFVNAVEEQCDLRLNPRSPATTIGGPACLLQAKGSGDATGKAEEGTKAEPSGEVEMQVDDPFRETASASARNIDSQPVLRFLVDELTALSKAGSETSTPEEANVRHCRENTTLLLLTELLGSYIDVKTAFVSAGRRSGKEAVGKSRPGGILNLVIGQLVCGLLFDVDVSRTEGAASPSVEQRRRVDLSNWSSASIVALCADISVPASDKENAQEMVNVRKVVMDAIAKALKDITASTEPINARYGKLWALCQLCYRLLTARPSVQPKTHDEGTLHIAKVMLEKSFVPLLTATLVDIDLQYPGVKNLVTSILLPLEHLTKLSTRMGKAERSKDARESYDEEMTSESDSDDSEEGSGSEDVPAAPDLYRNSALGMFGGAGDDFMDNSEDENGEGEDGADEYDEMDEMDDDDDSDGTEPSDDDEDEMEHDMEQWEDVDGDDDMDGENEVDVYADGDGMAVLGAPDLDMDDDGMDDLAGDGDLDEMDEMDEDEFDDGDMEDGEEYDEVDDDDQVSVYHELEMDAGLLSTSTGFPTAGATQNWGWAAQGQAPSDEDGARGQGTGHRRGHHHRFFRDEEADMAMFGRSRQDARSAAQPAAGISNHPLLQEHERGAIPDHQTALSPGLISALGLGNREQPDLRVLMHAIDQMMGGTGQAMQMLEGLASRGGPGGQIPDEIRIDLDHGPGGRSSIGIQLGPNGLEISGAPPGLGLARTSTVPAPRSVGGTEAMPQPTGSRWQEEEKIAVPVGGSGRIIAIAQVIIDRMLPQAKKAAAERKAAEDFAKLAKEREAEERRRVEAEAEAVAATRLEEEEAAATAAAASLVAPAEEARLDGDVDMAAAETTTADDVDPLAAMAEEHDEEDPPRVTIMIHGEEVDITETGIDPEFLEALPDDMRADVVNQHLRERRGPEDGEGAGSSEISPEFLDALPPEIRAEVIQQEAIEQARRNQAARPAAPAAAGNAGAGAGPAGGAAGARDPGTFLAGLDPGLRRVVLMEQEDDFLAGLPPAVAAGLDNIIGGPGPATWQGGVGGRRAMEWNGPGAPGAAPASKPKVAKRDAIQLLDRSGVASLARLLFFPDIFRKQNLLKILANLCENARNRGDLINLLLAVLQDEAGDLAYIEKQTATKDKKALPTTPKTAATTPTPRKKGIPETPSGVSSAVLGNLQSDSIPSFVAQRAFEGLAFIISNNEQATVYFLTEHDIPIVAKKTVARKAKAKDRPASQMAYPVVILMSLLARSMVLETPAMVESLTALLANLTKPLSQLEKGGSDVKVPAAKASSGSAAASSDHTDPIPVVSATATQTATEALVAGAEGVASGSADVKVADEDTPLLLQAPKIPAEALQLVVNVLTHGECTSRTFSHTLVLMQHLSYIPEAKEAICAELRSQAQSIGDTLAHDLRELSGNLGSLPAGSNAEEISMTKFTAASSSQAKLLRILKTIDYMFSPKSSTAAGGWDAAAIALVAEGVTTLSSEEETVNGIFESFHFNPVWDALGDCLGVVQEKSGLISVMTVLLPLVESLMVVSKYSSAKTLASKQTAIGASPMSPMSPKENVTDDTFFRFTNTHRKVLNTMVRNNPALMSGSFSLLVLNSRVLEFDNKRNWFTQQLRKKPAREVGGGTIHLTVRRSNVFGDSYQALQRKSGDALKYGKLSVKFHEEEGVDAGGVTREWYSILAREIFNPGYCLFEPCAADQLTYQPSQHSWVNDAHLSYFNFVGKIIGKAIYDGRLLDAYFSRAFYKQMLGRKVDIRDLESVDPEYHKSLVWMLDNDITGIIDLDFSLEAEEFGEKKIVDLKPDGSTIPVTEANKEEYVRLVCEHRLETAIAKQVKAFLEGFYDIIPRKLIAIFDPDQLELLISGISNIDVDELKNATQLHGWKNSDAEISWFWRALRSFSQEERARFLMFVTSSSRVPLGGFSQLQGSSGVQPFQIHKLYREDVLPSSATCFNELLLPSYPSYEALRGRLLTAITEGSGHFGLA